MQRCIALEEDRTLLLWLMIAVYEHSWVACTRLLVSADERKQQASREKAREKRRERKRGEELLLPRFSPGCRPFFSVLFRHYLGPLHFLLVMTGPSKLNRTWLKRRRWTRIRQVHLINQTGNWRRIIHIHVIYWVINSLVFSVLCIGSWKCCTIWSRFDCLKWSVQSLAWQQHHSARVCPGCQRWSSSV